MDQTLLWEFLIIFQKIFYVKSLLSLTNLKIPVVFQILLPFFFPEIDVKISNFSNISNHGDIIVLFCSKMISYYKRQFGI